MLGTLVQCRVTCGVHVDVVKDKDQGSTQSEREQSELPYYTYYKFILDLYPDPYTPTALHELYGLRVLISPDLLPRVSHLSLSLPLSLSLSLSLSLTSAVAPGTQ